MQQDKGTFGNMDCRHAAEAVGVTAAGGKSQSNQPGTERSPCILLLFTSVPLSARTATWRNYSHLTLMRKKGSLSGQLRQKSWLKEVAPQSRGSRRERARSIAPSGRLEQFLLVSTTADSSLSQLFASGFVRSRFRHFLPTLCKQAHT